MTNTIERLKQDKKITVIAALVVIAFTAVMYAVLNKNADDLYADLAAISAGEGSVLAEHYDLTTVVANELESVRVSLLSDLKAAGYDDSVSVDVLLQKATTYLASPEAIEQWLTGEIQRISIPQEEWQIEKTEAGHQQVMAGDECFTVFKQGKHWSLAAVSHCG